MRQDGGEIGARDVPRVMVPGLLLFGAASLPAAAQTFPTNDPVLKRIWDIGMNNSHTEQLAQALGVASRIVWRDEMSLKEFSAELAAADVVCDQLGESFPGMVALDAMALGIPVIANFRPELLERCFSEPVAGNQASTPAQVAAHLAHLASSPRARVSAGRAGRAFARKHLSPAANAARCLAHLGGAVA